MHLKTLGSEEHNRGDRWEVRFHPEFDVEFAGWAERAQDAALAQLVKLRKFGPSLGRPSADTLKGSDYPNMKELRVSADDGEWRIAFAFDPKRRAILLVGGNKSGVPKDRFYDALIRIADLRYRRHLERISKEKTT